MTPVVPGDFVTAVTTAFAGYAPALLAVGAAGIALSVVIWGFPKIVGFFKKTAK